MISDLKVPGNQKNRVIPTAERKETDKGKEEKKEIKIDLDFASTEKGSRTYRYPERYAKDYRGEVEGETFTAKVETLKRNVKGLRSSIGYASVPAVYVPPDKSKEEIWKEQVISGEDLREETPDVVKTKKPLGIRRYIFINDLLACKNGLLYYLVPLVINLVVLIVNFTLVSFLPNAIFAGVSVLFFLAIRRNLKDPTRGTVAKITFTVIGIAIYVALWILARRFWTRFYEKLYPPFTLKLILIVFGIYYFAAFYARFALAYAQDAATAENNKAVVEVKAGAPGAGKTSQTVQDAYVSALVFWNNLQYIYWNWHSREAEILKRNDTQELIDYYEIKTAYEYYRNNPEVIPCLWSMNIIITDSTGRRSSTATMEHLKGIERLPAYCVLVIDEIGASLNAAKSNEQGDALLDVANMFRLGRHFLLWKVYCCEQDYHNIYINCRRVIGKNTLILGQEWVNRPTVLYGIYKFLKFIIGDSLDGKIKRNKKLAFFMNSLEKFVKSIGFRRQVYKTAKNTETDAGASDSKEEQDKYFEKLTYGGARVRLVPSKTAAGYDDRAFRVVYMPRYDRNIRDGADDASMYKRLQAFVVNSSLIREKRDVVDEQIDKIV